MMIMTLSGQSSVVERDLASSGEGLGWNQALDDIISCTTVCSKPLCLLFFHL